MRSLALAALSLLASGCVEPEPRAEALPTIDEEMGASLGAFGDPEATCDALASEGFVILPRTRWNPDLTGGFDCTSDDLIVTEGFPLGNDVTFYVRGAEDGGFVEFARLTGNVFDTSAPRPVLDKLGESAVAFARYLGVDDPETVRPAASEARTETVPLGEYVAQIERETYNQGYGATVTFRRAE